MTDVEMEQMRANINKMVADVDFSNKSHELDLKKYFLEQLKLVLYSLAVGAAFTAAVFKILGD